mmetsp:Transcript_27063/g.42832  ORF Transcript_27063/g.42832 Transcript_27063/m.42832 type:complete len:621 (+) Transcript_27063:24-1886(+)
MAPTTKRSFLWLLLLLIASVIVSVVHAQSKLDPYKILNVPKHATQKEIRKAFKSLALKYHPDRNIDSADPDRMKKITAAYEILGDPAKRKKHDEETRQNNIFSAHGFRRSTGSTSDGIGAQLTKYNYHSLLYNNVNDLPWLILAYEDFSQPCKQAMTVFEEACIKLQGLARCAKLNVNKESTLINEFNLRRVPHFIVSYRVNGQQLQSSVAWKGREKVKFHTLIDAVADILPVKCKVLSTEQQMNEFLNDYAFDDAHYNKVKAVIFSDAKNRYSPHILLQYLATKFAENMEFAYIHMNTDRAEKLKTAYSMAQQIGVDAHDDLEPPCMYILRLPLIHKEVMAMNRKGAVKQLEDIGVYHISLSSDVDSMKMFVEQYSWPLIPKLDGSNFLELCYFDAALEELDVDKICYVFLVQREDEQSLRDMFVFAQSVLASLEESVQFAWMNCEQQSAFCAKMNVFGDSVGDDEAEKKLVKLAAIRAYQDYYQLYENGKHVDVASLDESVQKVVDWIAVLEKDEMVFGVDSCHENNTENCKKQKKEGGEEKSKGEEFWRKGILFPMKAAKWTDNIDGVLGGIGSVFGLVGSGVGASVSAVSTLLSYVFQLFFLVILFLFLLPMLRMR